MVILINIFSVLFSYYFIVSMPIGVFLKLGLAIPKRYCQVENVDGILGLTCRDEKGMLQQVNLPFSSLDLLPDGFDSGVDFIIMPLDVLCHFIFCL